MFERRLKIFLVLTILAFAAAGARLAQLQLFGCQDYRRQAEGMLVKPELLPTVRGKILDRKDRDLAMDVASYDLCLDFGMIDLQVNGEEPSPEDPWTARQIRRLRSAEPGLSRDNALQRVRLGASATWQLTQELTGDSAEDLLATARRTVRRVDAIRRLVGGVVEEENQPHPIVTGLSDATAVAVKQRLSEMMGASIVSSHRRFYPAAEAAAQLVGYMGPAEAVDPPAGAPLEEVLAGYMEGDDRGIAGVEKACEDLLRGTRGLRHVHRNGSVIDELPAQDGRDVHLTIDAELQRGILGLMDKPGAIVVLDVPTGEVLAMATFPTFDANVYHRQIAGLIRDYNLPLCNRPVAMPCQPGSVFKPMAALAGLAEGVLTATSTKDCRGYLISPTYPGFRCWTLARGLGGHGTLDVVGALEHSCNVFFYKTGEELGLPRLTDWLRVFGIGRALGTGLPEERAGLLPDPAKVEPIAESRYIAMGQGAVTATPMHVANEMAAIARGEYFQPLLIREFADRQGRWKLELPSGRRVTAEHLGLVRRGMYQVVNSPTGTAREARDAEIEICGKTGTAQTSPRRIDLDGDGRPDTLLVGDTVWFAGFAPYRRPQIAFAVMVDRAEKGRGGGTVCAPIGLQVVRLCRDLGYVRPE
jgi:penicillin-binding protein 2